MVKEKSSCDSSKTSETEVLQTPAAIEANLGQGERVVKVFLILKSLMFLKKFKISDNRKVLKGLNF